MHTVPCEITIISPLNNHRILKGDWHICHEVSRWNWSCYCGWFLHPCSKGFLKILDILREKWANRIWFKFKIFHKKKDKLISKNVQEN